MSVSSVSVVFTTSTVPPALYSTVNTLVGLDEMLYCENTHSFFGGEMHCTVPFGQAEFRTQASTGQVAFGRTATYKIPKVGDQVYWCYAVLHLPGIKGASGGDSSGCSSYAVYNADGCADFVAGESPTIAGKAAAGFLCSYGIPTGGAGWFFSDAGVDEDMLPAEAEYIAGKADSGRDLPSEQTYWAMYVNGVGHRTIRAARFKIGSQKIAEVWYDYLFAREELAGKPGKRLEEMVGYRVGELSGEVVDNLIVDSMQSRYLYVPLPFWFTKAPAHTLSLLHCSLAPCEVEMDFEVLSKLIVRNTSSTAVQRWDGVALRDDDLNCVLATVHIFLPEAERDRLMVHGNEKIQIIQQVLRTDDQITNVTHSVRLQFNLPTTELIFMVRRKCHADANDWFNYSGLGGMDVIDTMSLTVNNTVIENAHEGSYYRLVQPYQFHRLVPRAHVYCKSFALFPEEMLISGSLNFARYENAYMNLKLQADSVSSDAPGEYMCFAPAWNVLLYKGGGATVSFS